jgi:dihydrofolate synthase/folylpolyglutamate synthase
LAEALPAGWELWLDGGHNPGAGDALAATFREWRDLPLYLMVGMKRGKGAAGFLAPLLPLATATWAVAEPGQHLAMSPEEIVAASGGAAMIGGTVKQALAQVARRSGPARVVICGSLYLAGEVLKLS